MRFLFSKKQLEFALQDIEGDTFRRQGKKLGYESWEKIGMAYFVEGKSYSEIASELQITKEYARTKVSKINANLRKQLEKAGLEIQVSFVKIEMHSELSDDF